MNAPIRVWQVKAGAYVSGNGSRDLVLAVKGKPIWSRAQRAWGFGPQRIGDLLALAEHQGRRVEWLGVRSD